ncbi:MAG: hypothetical protein D6707_07600 [Bacteroidetes bacterium]|nr:MAG: hypothetical protein D6707_07600 [Bacteroidota bacterium]
MKKTVLIIGITLALFSCKHEPLVDSNVINESDNLIIDSICDSNTVYFINDVQPIINSSCAYSGCHDKATAKEGVDLSSYSSIITTGEVVAGNADESEIYEQIAKNEMPPGNPLTNEQKNIIKNWINQGAKYNECVESSDYCDTSSVSFANDIQPILNNNCTGCHNSNSASGNPPVILDNYNDVKTVADNGRLLGAVTGASGYAAMPPSGSLPQCDINKIKSWINNGAANN